MSSPVGDSGAARRTAKACFTIQVKASLARRDGDLYEAARSSRFRCAYFPPLRRGARGSLWGTSMPSVIQRIPCEDDLTVRGIVVHVEFAVHNRAVAPVVVPIRAGTDEGRVGSSPFWLMPRPSPNRPTYARVPDGALRLVSFGSSPPVEERTGVELTIRRWLRG